MLNALVMKITSSLAIGLVLSTLLVSATAGATEENTPAQPRKAAASDISLNAYSGILTASEDGIGAVYGGEARYRLHWVEIGGFGEQGSTLFGWSNIGVGGLVGAAWQSDFGLRLGLGAAGGEHFYTGVGKGFLSADPGVSASMPFVGARARISYLFGRGPAHFELGAVGSLESDLDRVSRSSTYVQDPWFGGSPTVEHAQHQVGFRRASVGMQLGFVYDVL
jgi:hypothetical protein